MPDRTTISRALDRLISSGAIKADGCILTVQNARETVQNAHENVQNARHIINNNINNNSSCLAGDAATPQPQQDKFIVPSFEEVLSYGRERGYDFKEMKKYYQYYSGNGWTLKRGAKMKSWPATLGFWMSRVEEKKACAAAAKFATLAQAGFRPENRSYEHASAMNERKKEDKAMEAIYSDEDKKELSEMYERLGVKQFPPPKKEEPPNDPPPQSKPPSEHLSDDERMARLGISLEEREIMRKSQQSIKERQKKKGTPK